MPEERPISILGQSEQIDQRLGKIIKEMMAGVTISSLRDFGPLTPVDIQEVGDFVSEEQLLKWAELVIGSPVSITEEERLNLTPSQLEEREKEMVILYEKLDEAYQKAKFFLWDVVGYEDKEIKVRDPGKLNSKDSLVRLLKNIKTVKGDTGGLDQSIKYCRLVKATIAAFESIKHDALFLESITAHFEKSLFSTKKGEALLWEVGSHDDGLKFWVEDKDEEIIIGTARSRSKKFGGVLLRLLNRPEANAAVALKDGTGVQIIIDQQQSTRLIPIILEWLLTKTKHGHIILENEGYLSDDEKLEVARNLETRVKDSGLEIEEGVPNGQSGKKFRTFKILGMLEFSGEDASIVVQAQNGMKKSLGEISGPSRKFEIQFLADLKNENEKGRNNHFVYDAKKLIAARTRLDGWCGEEAFERYINDASNHSGIPSSSVREYILGVYDKDMCTDHSKEYAMPADVVEYVIKDEKTNRQKKIYVDFSVYKRWRDHGIVGKEIFDNIREARKWHPPELKES